MRRLALRDCSGRRAVLQVLRRAPQRLDGKGQCGKIVDHSDSEAEILQCIPGDLPC
jgi:hypothetical protein